ncbi:MAG: TRZ/ATZ family hydrolase [Rhodocyclaceae bacterium]|jgi:5-methylthioadenosine/S-adenosylhomocysteine deaminase|nr:TRZ/ATZ family hydrolase [Rhodocyclaceae bacterium]
MTSLSAPFPQPVDLVIDARWIVPVEPAEAVLENHSLIADKGRILDLLPTAEAGKRYAGNEHLQLDNHVLTPGLVNLHTHAAMALLRGYADDMALMRWLQERIWPAESRHVSPAFVHDGTLLACWEMLRGGITCFNDMYFFPEDAARAALAAGIRAVLGITVFEFPSAYGTGPTDYLDKGLRAREALRDDATISFCLAPHAPYTVSDATFERVAAIAAEIRAPIHVHLHETGDEIAGSLKEHGVRPVARLRRLGLLGPGLIAVHAVHLNPDEIALLGESGCHVAHCPTSNMKLASGIAPVGEMLAQGMSVGLGTDGAASNNRLDLFQEMRHAALLAKVAGHDAALLPAHQALRMATLEGARALGLDREIGSLRPGKAADLLAVRLDDWLVQPCFDPVSHLVYVAGREAVSHVWVAGKQRIANGMPIDLDSRALLDKTKMWQNALTCRT